MTQAVIQTTVTGMQGRPIATTVPAANQAYTWSGTAWAPTGPYLPLAGGVLSGPLRLQYNAPLMIYNDPSISITAGGLWRMALTGGAMALQSNTATAGDFSTAVTGLQINAAGGVSVANGLNVSGAMAATGNVSGNQFLIPNAGNYNSPTTGIIRMTTTAGVVFQVAGNDPNFAFLNNGTPQLTVASITSAGNMTLMGTLSQGSDGTTKNTIAAYEPGVSIAAQLLPKSFIYNGDATNTQHLGFIAQDVQPILPAAVSASPTAEGGSGVATLGLDVTAIVAVLANAVKQLITRVQALETHASITPAATETA